MTDITVGPELRAFVEAGYFESVHYRFDVSGGKTFIVPGERLIGTHPFTTKKKYELEIALALLEPKLSPKKTKLPPLSNTFRKEGSGTAEGGTGPSMVQIPVTRIDADRLHSRFNLGKINKNGVNNVLPSDSLHLEELSRPHPLVVARAIRVAGVIGEAKAVSRITSDLSKRKVGCSTLSEWWEAATPLERWWLLTSRKASGEAKQGPPKVTRVLQSMECPFQDTHFEMETFNSEDEEESFGGVSFSSY